jgi:single-stranded DNA-binding protein
MILKKVKKGDRITVTGYGRTKNWKNIEGIVSHRRKNKVFVVWEGTKFHIEDEMDIREVRKVDGVKINKK